MTVSEDFTGLTGGVPGGRPGHCYRVLGAGGGGQGPGRGGAAAAGRGGDRRGTRATRGTGGRRGAGARPAGALPAEDGLAEPAGPEARAVLDRFAAAFENADASALAELLREDVALEMPPLLTWFAGRQAVARFFAASPVFDVPGRLRLVPVRANRQPAFAAYLREPRGAYPPDAA